MTTNMDLLIAGRYHIVKTLGKGGFGETFLARDTHLPSQRLVVVKRLRQVNPSNRVSPEIIADLFKKEAQVLEELGQNCPQIPTLYAYFVENEQYYLVQEYIEGCSLADLGKIDTLECRRILCSLLKVLEYIHGRKIIHRDIKPENIIIRERDRLPILIDFGAVKEAMGTVVLSSGSMISSVIVGTKGFMPPEQSAGRTVYASDLYALALTMIYSITGKYPIEFPVDTLTGDLQWQAMAPQTDPQLMAVLTKASKVDLGQRYKTAQEMLYDLTLSEIKTVAVVPPKRDIENTKPVPDSTVSTPTVTLPPISTPSARRTYEHNPSTIPSAAPSYAPPPPPPNAQENTNTSPTPPHPSMPTPNSPSEVETPSNNWPLIIASAIVAGVMVGGGLVVLEYVKQTRAELAAIEQQRAEMEARLAEEQRKREEEARKREEAERLRQQQQAELERIRAEALRRQQKEQTRTIIVQPTPPAQENNNPMPSSPPEVSQDNQETFPPDNPTDSANPEDNTPTDNAAETLDNSNSANSNTNPPADANTSVIAPSQAMEALVQFYNLVSQKQFPQARIFFANPNNLDPGFFQRFSRVTVENLRVVYEGSDTITLLGTNTYYYPDGTKQIEERDFTMKIIDGVPKIVNSRFRRVLEPRR
ncbi:MAG: serine/threonine protein kinase [Geminocystis sp.]|nr:serine/threonine protein kinase [Geminocystis sp.]